MSPTLSSVSSMLLCMATLLTLSSGAALALLALLQIDRREIQFLKQRIEAKTGQDFAMLDAIPVPIRVTDRSGRCIRLNSASLQDETATTAMTSEDGRSANYFESADSGRGRRDIEYQADDGSARVGTCWHGPILDAQGNPDGAIDVLFDITDLREAEQSARMSEQRFREITQHIPLVVFTIMREPDGVRRLDFISGDLASLFRMEVPELLEQGNVLRDKAFHDRVHPEDLTLFVNLLDFDPPQMQTRLASFRTFGERGLRWIQALVAPHAAMDGSVHLVGYFMDTTEINSHNEALRIARDVAEKASKAKASFLAVMSHEIRTPMNGIMGMLELLTHTSITDEQRDLLRAIDDSAGVLLQVLNDVLDFSKLEAGDMRLDIAPFDPRVLIDNIVSVMSAEAHRKNIEMRVYVDAMVAGTILGDSVRIRQILLNFLSNAGKFTDHGAIEVCLRVIGDDGTRQRLRLSVKDTGIGIAHDKQVGVFESFNQGESWTSRRHGGTGLGLSICKHLSRLMDGMVGLQSDEGEGTEVYLDVILPIASREATSPPGLRQRHAIVRTHSAFTASALSDYLSAMGITVEQIPPPVPLRPGLAATFVFADQGEAGPSAQVNAPVIVVNPHERVPLRSANEDGRIVLSSNPLHWQSIVRACLLAMDTPATGLGLPPVLVSQPTLATGLSDARPSGRILVAEDHPVSQDLVSRQLRLLGWAHDIVDDGQEAMLALRRQSYTLLLTDCNMPNMDGYALSRLWRQHENEHGLTTRLPIIAMTAHAMPGEDLRCREAGMDDYVSKPLLLDALSVCITRWMPPGTPAPDEGNTIGMDRMNQGTGTSDEVNLLAMFRETTASDLIALEEATTLGDIPSATKRLHRILGVMSLFTSDSLIFTGRRMLETAHYQGDEVDVSTWRAYVVDLKALLARLDT